MLIRSFLRLLRNKIRLALFSARANRGIKRKLRDLNPQALTYLAPRETQKSRRRIADEIYHLVTTQHGSWTLDGTIFAKLTAGNQGKGCFKCEKQGDTYLIDDHPVTKDDLLRAIPGHLIENYIVQHPSFAAVHPQSVNEVRIITVRKGDEIQVYGAFARFGVGDMHVDNLYAGGLFVGVYPDGHTANKGYIVFGEKRGCYLAHPDSGVDFSQYSIPMWEQCCECARAAHREFPFLHSCGWDVGITPAGPIIIEGNAGWGSVYLQIWFGPAREKIQDFFPSPGC